MIHYSGGLTDMIRDPGTNLSSKRDMFQGPDDAEDSLGMLGWVFDPMFQLLRDKAFGIQEVWDCGLTRLVKGTLSFEC